MLDLSEVTWNDVVIPNVGENASGNTKQTNAILLLMSRYFLH
jgi:hypothetical protein